jgi:hypothetical protein
METCMVIRHTAVLGTRAREDSMKNEDNPRSEVPPEPYHILKRYRGLVECPRSFWT